MAGIQIDVETIGLLDVRDRGVPGVQFHDIHLDQADERRQRVGDEILTGFLLFADANAPNSRRRPDLGVQSATKAAVVSVFGFILTLCFLIEGEGTRDWLLAFVPQAKRPKVPQTLVECQRVIYAGG